MGGWDTYCFLCYGGLYTFDEEELYEGLEDDEREDGRFEDDEPADDEPADDEPADDELEDDKPEDEAHDNEAGDDEPEDDEPEDDEPEDAKSADGANGHSNARELQQLFLRRGLTEQLDWMSKFRTIGINRKATGLKQCYLSGPATHEDYGHASIELGDHPNARILDLGETNGEVPCYRSGDEELGDLPIHDNCLTILCEAFAQARGMKFRWAVDTPSTSLPFDLDTLFACLAPAREGYHSYLELGHKLECDQYFCIDWSNVYHYINPFESGMPELAAGQDGGEQLAQSAVFNDADNSTNRVPDLFSRLPTELLLTVMDYVPAMDLPALFLASRTAHDTTKANKFWKRRLTLDAP